MSLDISVLDLDLSTRTRNCLMRSGYRTIGGLMMAGRDQVSLIVGMGDMGLAEINKELLTLGLDWPDRGAMSSAANRPRLLGRPFVTAPALQAVADYIAAHCPGATAEQVVDLLRREARR